MEYYNLFDFKNSGLDNLNTGKYISIFVFAINILFVIIGFFNESLFYFLLVTVPVFFIFLFAHFFYKKRFGILISIEGNLIKVFNANKKFLRELSLIDIKTIKKEVEIYPRNRFPELIKTCLILYKDIELQDYIEYYFYWNDDNVLIIQNPELIEKVEEVLRTI